MARLSKKQNVRVSFLLHRLTLTDDQRQRETFLGDLLEALHIDADQAQQSRESAISHIRYEASRKRKSERQAKPDSDTDGLSPDELRRYLDELQARRDTLLAQRHIDAMSDEERAAYRDHLVASIAGKLEPAPVVSEADAYNLPTKRMEQAVAAFDDLTDSDQVDALRAMWA